MKYKSKPLREDCGNENILCVKISHKNNFCDEREIFAKNWFCENCNNPTIFKTDKYCSECGAIIEWTE